MSLTNKKAYIYKMKMLPANVLSIIIFVLFLVVTVLLNRSVFIGSENFVVFSVAMILYLCLHELLHGLGFYLGGTKRKNIKYGMCLEKGIFYCMAYQEISKKNILISLQMPFMVIGVITYIIGVVSNIPLLTLLSIINLTGASMDIVMFMYILKLPKDITYSESKEPDEFVLISNTDLTKKKNLFFEITKVKDYKKEDYVFKNTKKVEISKTSIIILVVFVIVGILMSII